jgi:hypothetical protein
VTQSQRAGLCIEQPIGVFYYCLIMGGEGMGLLERTHPHPKVGLYSPLKEASLRRGMPLTVSLFGTRRIGRWRCRG